jgi:hypothetical protein
MLGRVFGSYGVVPLLCERSKSVQGGFFVLVEICEFIVLRKIQQIKKFQFSPGKVAPTLRKLKGGVALGTEPYTCRVERRFSITLT